jgi:hypothetical protein
MKKFFVSAAIICSGTAFLSAQEKIVVHGDHQVLYESLVSELENIRFQNASSFFNHFDNNELEIPLASIDSITFSYEPPLSASNAVYIRYNGNRTEIINRTGEQEVQITDVQGNVTVTSTSNIPDIEYVISGTTENGSLTLSSYQPLILTLDNLHITSPASPAIRILSEVEARINTANNTVNDLSDGSTNAQSAVLTSKGALILGGEGALNINAHAKHAVFSDKSIRVESGTIAVTEAVSDGFHAENFVMDGGNLNLSAGSDGIDAGTVEINSGAIRIISLADGAKGIKGKDAVIINGGDLSIVASGAAVLEPLNVGYDPSYCTAVKCDGNITINGGTVTIESKNTSNGGKGISADGDIVVNDGNIRISTAGNGAVYTNGNNVSDSYTACCLKSDANILLGGGTITCSSSGTGGKGISAGGTLIIGKPDTDNAFLNLSVTTSGERFLVSGGSGGGGGGGRPGGGQGGNSGDYANPKAIKSEGALTINSGTITVNCTQTGEGGEGIESKTTLTILGGNLNVHSNDDAINAASNITIAGGSTYCSSSGNDAIDSNGTLTITGGFTVANGARSPEEGFDCDNNTFSVKGGILVGTGGATSNPTASACTQRSVKYTGTPGSAICLKNSSGEIILLYQMPSFSGSGQGGGQGGNNMVVLFSDPRLLNGSYTLQYGGSITGGVTVNGYNTGGDYSGGSQRNVTINSMLTTIQ